MWKHVLSRINSQKLKDSAVLYSPSGWWKVWWHFVVRKNISGAPEQNRGCGILLNDWSRRRLVLFFIPQCWYWIFSIMSHSQDGRKGNICSTYIHPHTDICLLICISLYTHKKKYDILCLQSLQSLIRNFNLQVFFPGVQLVGFVLRWLETNMTCLLKSEIPNWFEKNVTYDLFKDEVFAVAAQLKAPPPEVDAQAC